MPLNQPDLDPASRLGQDTQKDHPLLEAVRKLGPLIREHADEAERNRRLSRPVIDAMASAGLFRLYAPQSIGGFEVDPATYARIVEEVSRFDSAAGWALQAGNTGDWWAARLPAEGVEEVYGNGPDVLTAAAFHPPQRAVEVDGGYRVTGRGPLASNIHDADWLFLTAMVMDGEQPRMAAGRPEVVGLTFHPHEAQILDTWYSLGMRGTDSNDVVVEDVFVPAQRAYALAPEFEPNPHFRGPLYRFPVIGQTATIAAPVALGVAREAIDALRELAQGKTPFGTMKLLRDRVSVQAELARAEGMLRAARLLFYSTLAEAWERTRAGKAFTLEQKADLLLAGAHAMKSASEVAERMHRLAGTSGIYARSPIERHFRDAQTLRHHGFVSESRFEAVGQVYLGLPPEFGMVAF